MFIFVICLLNYKILFRFLLILLLVYLVVRMFNRIAISSFAYPGEKNPNKSQQTGKEGSVTLEKNEKSEKIISKDEGEYVDYEEIK
jgi:hypothetical protein